MGLLIPLSTSLLVAQIRHLLTLCAFMNFIYLLTTYLLTQTSYTETRHIQRKLGLIELKPGLDHVYIKTRPNKTKCELDVVLIKLKPGLDVVYTNTRPNKTKAWVRCRLH